MWTWVEVWLLSIVNSERSGGFGRIRVLHWIWRRIVSPTETSVRSAVIVSVGDCADADAQTHDAATKATSASAAVRRVITSPASRGAARARHGHARARPGSSARRLRARRAPDARRAEA